ncbi:Leucyl aminopeptidase yscIV, partial [Blyttiomyces sp. JEL0837]
MFLVKTNLVDMVKAYSAIGQKALFDVKYTGTFSTADSFNVICDTVEGDANNTVVIGAHLDGVPAGPGIVDNASGSASVLEIALTLYRSGYNRRLKNRIRFAWWGAEELGLLGSYAYLAKLKAEDPEELSKIALAQNQDMLAAPNGFADIGAGATAPDSVKGPSTVIENVLNGIFNTSFPTHAYHVGSMAVGGSDFFPFLEYDIPAASLATGA